MRIFGIELLNSKGFRQLQYVRYSSLGNKGLDGERRPTLTSKIVVPCYGVVTHPDARCTCRWYRYPNPSVLALGAKLQRERTLIGQTTLLFEPKRQ
jgi:hypothetical protein